MQLFSDMVDQARPVQRRVSAIIYGVQYNPITQSWSGGGGV